MLEGRALRRRLNGAAALAVALAIFALDALSPLQGAVAVLYTLVVLMVARNHDRQLVLATSGLGALLAAGAYVVSHGGEPFGSPAMRLAVSLVAIAVTAWLCLRNQAAVQDRLRSEARYRTIFSAAGIAIWETDWSAAHSVLRRGQEPDAAMISRVGQTAVLRDANDAAARLFGLTDRAALIGGTLVAYYTPAAEATLGRIVSALLRGDPVIDEETRFRTAAGTTVDVVLRVTLPPGGDGWSRVLVMALDMTERNRAQAKLAQSQAELTHVSRITTLGQLAASIAHEVNQPLAAILTFANSGKRWLAREAPDAAEVADCLGNIATTATRAADVITRIRDLARRADPKRERVILGPLVDATLDLLRRELQAHGVALHLSGLDGLPPICGDRVQIQQVLMNLLLNADQAMIATPADQRILSLEVWHDAETIVLAIRDRGVGIAGNPEALFAPFFTTKVTGLGMGLSICRSIIEQHGGTLVAANNADGGATFTVRLPVTQETPSDHDSARAG